METREEVILNVCSSSGEVKEKYVANNKDEGDVHNEQAIEQLDEPAIEQHINAGQ